MVSLCDHCDIYAIWVHKLMVYPDYDEARGIVSRSPRSAAALLRLAIEKLTDNLLGTEKGKDLNDNIKILVQKGLPVKIQKALDYLRAIGNNAVHPLGKIDLRDNQKVANSLFDILNMIVDDVITEPRK